MNFLDSIWLIPLFPLLGAVVMLALGRRFDPQPVSPEALAPELAEAESQEDAHAHDHHHFAPSRKLISLFCPGMILLSLIFSLGAVVQLAATSEKVHEVIKYTWMAGLPFHLGDGSLGRFAADMGFLLDPLSSVMILVVTFVGFLIHVYSIGYMGHEAGYYRFFGYMNLFVFFMLTLVLANNYVLLFVGWEGVGLCSYLLIGFYFHKKSAGDAGKKAFIVNRIGDAAFMIGMFLVFAIAGSVRFTEVNEFLHGLSAETAGFGILSLTALLFFAGATGKSAQIPLYVWLPDAMEGPTPVSALIHAATMVTAGVYMVARSNALYILTPHTSLIVATIGALTAIFAASIALTQTDIKRVLAYSTVSQLGYMFLAAGVGAYWVAIFHLYTHAFFKALLFLGSGSVIHAMGGEQDMRHMGGLKQKIPKTFWTMFVASLAISGIPGLAGFFSKDEILWQVWSSPLGSTALWAIGMVTALMTAFYMWRLMYMTFWGECRADEHTKEHIHESPNTMTVPLTVLAIGSAIGGWIAVPKVWGFLPDVFFTFEHWLEPVWVVAHEGAEHGHHDTAAEWGLMGLSVLLAICGILLARYMYVKRTDMPDRVMAASGPLYKGSLNKWYVDEIYDFLFVNGLSKGGGRLMARFDQKVVDGGVNGAGWTTRTTSSMSGWWDTWIVDGSIRLLSFLVKMASYPVRLLQSGYVQQYAFVMVAGAAIALGYYLLK
jgi:NADH-quinone oxidoreductase subunit L